MVTPSQVRHLLPSLIYDRLAAVRAYDDALVDADDETLHALRIEFKRLRYTVSLFGDVLGTTIAEYVAEVKIIQDTLGRINDAVTAGEHLDTLLDSDEKHHSEALNAYIAYMETDKNGLADQFKADWERFNSRKVQQKLSTAVLSLR